MLFFHILHDILEGFLLLDVHPIADILFVLPIVHHGDNLCADWRLLINLLILNRLVLMVRRGAQSCVDDVAGSCTETGGSKGISVIQSKEVSAFS